MDSTEEKQKARRVIKRYSNRKLYDTQDSRYVTLLQIAEMVRAGEDVQIIDNTTKEDKTEVTLALAISEELKTKPRSVPLGTLRTLIQERGEKLLTSLRDGPIGRFIPHPDDQPEGTTEGAAGDAPATEGAHASERPEGKDKEKESRISLGDLVATSRHTLDQWQHAIDDRIKAVLPSFSLVQDIQTELRKLATRLQEIEKRLGVLQKETLGASQPPEPAKESAEPVEPSAERVPETAAAATSDAETKQPE